MIDKDKKILARLKALEKEERYRKNKQDLIEIQPIVNSCVFHYTNAGTLIGMLHKTSKENPFMTFWASHVSYMNDPKEKEYGIEKLWEVLRDVENDLSIPTRLRITELDQEELDKFIYLQNVREDSLTNIYSISFSKSFDSLPMWNMYGHNGNGICLGFDLECLNEYLYSQKMERIDRIIYGVGEDVNEPLKAKEEMGSWKKYVKDIYVKSMNFFKQNTDYDADSVEQTEIYDINIVLNNYMALLATIPGYIKNPAYKYEEEYRLCCREFGQEVHFRDCNGLLLPYIEVKLPLNALKIVVTGPTVDNDRQMMSINKLLEKKCNNNHNITFYSSEIPYITR